MKTKLLIISLLVFFSCSSKHEKKEKKELPSSAVEASINPEKQLEPIKKIDTLSFQNFLQLSDNIIEEIPRYHIDKFIGNKWDDENDDYRKIYSEEMRHYKLYENYIMTFSVTYYGVAGETVLASYTPQGQMIDHLAVEQSSDMDLASPSYSSRSWQLFADSLVQVLDESLRARNYPYHMPDTIELFDLDSTEVIQTLNYSFYVIKRSGEFEEVFPVKKVLDKEKLEKLSLSQLRLKRNEIFARLGYTFKSPDLLEHFSQFSWYSPNTDDVTNKLTAFDRYNVQMIRDLEDKKHPFVIRSTSNESTSNSFAQAKEAAIKETQIIQSLKTIDVIITQYKSEVESAGIPLCKAQIEILKSGTHIKSVEFSEIEAVGGHYGLLVYNEKVKDHIVISKFGDYDGKTIIINDKGEIFQTIGGIVSVDLENGFLFSIHDSDLAGFSVFDLNQDKEIFKMNDLEDRPLEFYKIVNNRFLYKAINDESEEISIWEIEFDLERCMQLDLKAEELTGQALKKLTDYSEINVNCE